MKTFLFLECFLDFSHCNSNDYFHLREHNPILLIYEYPLWLLQGRLLLPGEAEPGAALGTWLALRLTWAQRMRQA